MSVFDIVIINYWLTIPDTSYEVCSGRKDFGGIIRFVQIPKANILWEIDGFHVGSISDGFFLYQFEGNYLLR